MEQAQQNPECPEMKLKEVPDTIRTALNDLDKRCEHFMAMVPAAIIAEQAREELELLQAETTRISASSGLHSLNGILINVDVNDIKEITPILRWFARHGWRMANSLEYDKNPDDYPEIRRRTWKLVDETGVREHGIKINAFFRYNKEGEENDKVCRYVQVGIKEVPVWELRCPSIAESGDEK